MKLLFALAFVAVAAAIPEPVHLGTAPVPVLEIAQPVQVVMMASAPVTLLQPVLNVQKTPIEAVKVVDQVQFEKISPSELETIRIAQIPSDDVVRVVDSPLETPVKNDVTVDKVRVVEAPLETPAENDVVKIVDAPLDSVNEVPLAKDAVKVVDSPLEMSAADKSLMDNYAPLPINTQSESAVKVVSAPEILRPTGLGKVFENPMLRSSK